MREISRRLVDLEKRRPPTPRRVAIITEYDAVPTDADFVVVLVAATAETVQ